MNGGQWLGGPTRRNIDRTESIDGAERDGNRTDRTEYLPEHAKSLQAFEIGTARPQERPQSWPPKLPRGAFLSLIHISEPTRLALI
eukprot:8043266-Alexandrium_andersonii.AAC.1